MHIVSLLKNKIWIIHI